MIVWNHHRWPATMVCYLSGSLRLSQWLFSNVMLYLHCMSQINSLSLSISLFRTSILFSSRKTLYCMKVEPQLKYERMSNDLASILSRDAASCLAVHSKVTYWIFCVSAAFNICIVSMSNREWKNLTYVCWIA